MNLFSWLNRKQRWSNNTFGRTNDRFLRVEGIIKHVESEVLEIKKDPCSLEEWMDLAMLAFEGAHRAGWTSHEICQQLEEKLSRNQERTWNVAHEGSPNFHVKEEA